MDTRYVQRKLSRRQLLELRRAQHERYLVDRLWRERRAYFATLTIEGREAVVRTTGGLEVRFPAEALFELDALSRRGF